jgi:hypothetical protein
MSPVTAVRNPNRTDHPWPARKAGSPAELHPHILTEIF